MAVRVHTVGVTQEQRELLASDRGLGLLGYLIEYLVEAQVRREVAERCKEPVGGIVLLAHTGLERLHTPAGERDRALRDERTAGDQHAAGDGQKDRSRQGTRAGEQERTSRNRKSGLLRAPQAG